MEIGRGALSPVNVPWKHLTNLAFLSFGFGLAFVWVFLFCFKWDFGSCNRISLDEAIPLLWSNYLSMRDIKMTYIFELLDEGFISF